MRLGLETFGGFWEVQYGYGFELELGGQRA
jgi:hypothetical protein